MPAPPFPVAELTTEQMVEVDRAMMQDYGIELIQMMENAGRHLAHFARVRFLAGDPRGKRVVVLAGTGGNGGGALVCARWLHNWGSRVEVLTTKPAEAFTPVPAHQLAILARLKVPVERAEAVASSHAPELIVDGVVGYSLTGPPRTNAAALIRWANAERAPILSLDVPSGLDASTGLFRDPTVRATATLTLALPKIGLRGPGAESHVGELYLADIGVPPELYFRSALGLSVGALFAEAEILRLV